MPNITIPRSLTPHIPRIEEAARQHLDPSDPFDMDYCRFIAGVALGASGRAITLGTNWPFIHGWVWAQYNLKSGEPTT